MLILVQQSLPSSPLRTGTPLNRGSLTSVLLKASNLGTTISPQILHQALREYLCLSCDLITESLFRHPSSILINGKGRYAGGPEVDFAVINVNQGKRSAVVTFIYPGHETETCV
jgi:hypothetical protein